MQATKKQTPITIPVMALADNTILKLQIMALCLGKTHAYVGHIRCILSMHLFGVSTRGAQLTNSLTAA